MGYRSKVVALFYTTPVSNTNKTDEETEVLNKRNQATLDLFVRENFPEALRGPISDSDGLHRDETRGMVVWKFQNTDVKWYDSYPEVQAFEAFWDKFMELAEEPEEGGDPIFWACEFMRIGEEDDDVEQKSSRNCEWLLYLQRSIEINY